MEKVKTINPNALKVRDTLMVCLINGATKSGIHRNFKKYNRKARQSKSWQKEY